MSLLELAPDVDHEGERKSSVHFRGAAVSPSSGSRFDFGPACKHVEKSHIRGRPAFEMALSETDNNCRNRAAWVFGSFRGFPNLASPNNKASCTQIPLSVHTWPLNFRTVGNGARGLRRATAFSFRSHLARRARLKVRRRCLTAPLRPSADEYLTARRASRTGRLISFSFRSNRCLLVCGALDA